MKILINQDIFFEDHCFEDEYLTYVTDLLKECSIFYRIEGNRFVILTQKITLDEWDINDLFHNVFFYFPGLSIRYAALGGAGCDFSIELMQDLSSPDVPVIPY